MDNTGTIKVKRCEYLFYYFLNISPSCRKGIRLHPLTSMPIGNDCPLYRGQCRAHRVVDLGQASDHQKLIQGD